MPRHSALRLFWGSRKLRTRGRDISLVTRPRIYVLWMEQRGCSNKELVCGHCKCGICDVSLIIKTLFGPGYGSWTRSSSSPSSSFSSPPPSPLLFYTVSAWAQSVFQCAVARTVCYLHHITHLTTSPFPHSLTWQLSPFSSSVRPDRLSWHSIKSLPLPSPPPAQHHRFPSVKRPQVHPPLLSPAVPL